MVVPLVEVGVAHLHKRDCLVQGFGSPVLVDDAVVGAGIER